MHVQIIPDLLGLRPNPVEEKSIVEIDIYPTEVLIEDQVCRLMVSTNPIP